MKRGHTNVDLNYMTSSTGDAGDTVGGLDRFGRVVDQNWKTSGGTVKDRFQYTYDRNGNRLTKANSVNSSYNEVFTYDDINQIKTYNLGSGAHTQSWDYDGLGNWDSVTTDGGSPQTRTHNAQNEILTVSGQTSPTFDSNDNMTKDETDKRYVYDAWNRQVQVKNSSNAVIATYSYDAITRRLTENDTTDTKHLYYSAGWQVLEERLNSGTTANIQYVWSPVYIDAMVLRDRDANISNDNVLEERLWVAQDANFNVTALIDNSGNIVETFTYDAFGLAIVRNASYVVQSVGSDYAWIYRHQGGRWSSVSGLINFRLRPVSTTLGTWLNNDPVLYTTKDMNLYRANNNNPIKYLDPLGTIPTIPEFALLIFYPMERLLGRLIEVQSRIRDIVATMNAIHPLIEYCRKRISDSVNNINPLGCLSRPCLAAMQVYNGLLKEYQYQVALGFALASAAIPLRLNGGHQAALDAWRDFILSPQASAPRLSR